MQAVIDKAKNSARGADRMGDGDVINVEFAKELIEEAYYSGVLTERGWFQRGNGSWSHEKDGLIHRTIADAVKTNF